jgi:hypothetical protein
MQLIHVLASGVVGAGNGSARLYQRGTSTRATWYADFEAENEALSSGADISLDSNGRAVAYVNQLVRVEVYDSLGTLVLECVEGQASPAVEVISEAFTGSGYGDAAAAAGLATTLQSVLDRWLDSGGAPDWKILDSDGNPVTIVSILGGLTGLVFNVKTYDAVGDGVADDTAAITAAIAACVAAGGGIVFFPAGTYKITSTLTWSATVSFLGAGSGVSIITMDHATEDILSLVTVGRRFMVGLALQTSQTNTGQALDLNFGTSISHVTVAMCAIGSGTSTGTLISIAGAAEHIVSLLNNRFLISGATNGAISCTSTNADIVVDGNEFFMNEATYTGTIVLCNGEGHVTNNTFRADGHTTGAIQFIANSEPTSALSVLGNLFIVGSGTATCVTWATGAMVHVSGNSWPATASTFTRYGVSGILAKGSRIMDWDHVVAALAGTTYTIANDVGELSINATSTQPTFTLPAISHPGQKLTVSINNNSGGGWAGPYLFTGQIVPDSATAVPNLGNGVMNAHQFVAMDYDNDGDYQWVRLSP